jgi:Ca2+-binding EF-hand superfamily protein
MIRPFVVIHSNKVDYVSFLKHVGVHSKHKSIIYDVDQIESIFNEKIDAFNIVGRLKALFLDSINKLQKDVDEVYKMFSRWDTEGTGDITTTQFFRSLRSLHVHLSDHDQDLLVELLDVNNTGRVNFEQLLAFCLAEKYPALDTSSQSLSLKSLRNYHQDNMSVDQSIGGASSSDLKSDTSNISNSSSSGPAYIKRPSSQRPQSSRNRLISDHTDDQLRSPEFSTSPGGDGTGIIRSLRQRPQRPFTASGRVSSSSYTKIKTSMNEKLEDDVALAPDNIIDDDPEHEISWFHHHQEMMDARSFDTASNTINTSEHDDLPSPLIKANRIDNQNMGDFKREVLESLQRLREICTSSLNAGQQIREVFKFFDRKSTNVEFDLHDFLSALSDIDMVLNERVAYSAFHSLTVPGFETVSYGEFVSFIIDPDYYMLALPIQQEVSSRLERNGKSFADELFALFKAGDASDPANHGLIPAADFIQALQALKLPLNQNHIQRLVQHFDHDGSCTTISSSRFIAMITTSPLWLHAMKILDYQAQSVKESSYLREQLHQNASSPLVQGITEELLSMAEYLGIRPLSDRPILWIASEALNAALPAPWISKMDQNGRNFFYNSQTKQSQWDHPLDPQFKQLRDQHRQMMTSPKKILNQQMFHRPFRHIKDHPEISSNSNQQQHPSNHSKNLSRMYYEQFQLQAQANEKSQTTKPLRLDDRMKVFDKVYNAAYTDMSYMNLYENDQHANKTSGNNSYLRKKLAAAMTEQVYRPASSNGMRNEKVDVASKTSRRPVSGKSRPRSAVDRLSNFTAQQALLQPNRNASSSRISTSPSRKPRALVRDVDLADMFDASLITRLDSIILPRR